MIALNKLLLFAILGFVLTFGLPASASFGGGITYHGRIIKPDGNAETDSSVSFLIQIYTPGSEQCLLYETTVVRDLSASSGAFSITIDGSLVRTDGSGYTLDQIFANRTSGTYSFTAGKCASGTTYNPGASDSRKMIVQFQDSTMGSPEPLPTQSIVYAPTAIEAYEVGGFPSASLLRVENGSGPQSVSSLTPTQAANLVSLADGSSTQYVQSGTNGAGLPSFTTDPSSPSAGDIWYDSTDKIVKYYDGTSPQPISSLPSVGTAGTYTKVTTDAQGRVTSGAQITGDDITSGTIQGSTAINSTGNITLTGGATVSSTNITSTSDSTNNLNIWDGTSHKVTVTAPVGLAADYALTLPTDEPASSGMALVSTTAGVLSWAPVGTGNGDFMKDGSVTMTGPLKMTPDTLPGSPVAGEIVFDSGASNALKFYNGTSWQTVSTGSGSGDFMKDGSVAMTGDFDAGTKNLTNIGTGITAAADVTLSAGGTNKGITLTPTGTGIVTSSSPLAITPASLPAAPVAGELAFDSAASNALKYYNGTSWQTVGTGTGTGDFKADGSVAMTGNFDGGTKNLTNIGTNITAAAGVTLSAGGTNNSIGLTPSGTGIVVSASPLAITPASLPVSPVAGELAFDSAASNALKYYNGTSWQTVGTGTGTGDFKADGSVAMTGDFDGGTKNLTNIGTNITAAADVNIGAGGTNKGITLTPTGTGVVTSSSPLVVTPASLPASAVAGELAFDSAAANALKFYNGSAWQTVGTGTGSGDFMKDGSVAMTGNLKLGANYISNDGGATEGLAFDTSGNANFTGKVGIGTTTSSSNLSFTGQSSQTIGMERNSTSNTAGNNLTLRAGSATSGASNKNGGDLYLQSGTATGTGTSSIYLQISDTGAAATTDNSLFTVLSLSQSGGWFHYWDYNSGSWQNGFLIENANNTAAGGAALTLAHSYNGAGGVGAGDVLGQIDFRGYTNNTGKVLGAQIRSNITSITTNQDKASITFATNKAGTLTDQMIIDWGGNVGIGTMTPSQLLDVNGPIHILPAALPGTPTAGVLAFDSGASNALKYYDGSAWQTVGTGSGSGDFMKDGSVAMTGNLKLGANYISNDGGASEGLAFDTSGNANFTGKVGIGTTSPNSDLSFGGSANRAIAMERNTSAATGYDLTVQAGGGGAGTDISGGDLNLNGGNATGNGSSQVRINVTNAGQGSGSTVRTPATTIPIATFDGGYRSVALGEGAISQGWYSTLISLDGTTTYTGTQDNSMVVMGGNVGIGTITPKQLLDVNGPVHIAPATLPGSPTAGVLAFDSGASNALKYYDGTTWQTVGTGTGTGDFMKDGSVAMTGNIQLNGHYLSGDGGNEGVSVDSSGNVGIGTTSVGLNEKLDIIGMSRSTAGGGTYLPALATVGFIGAATTGSLVDGSLSGKIGVLGYGDDFDIVAGNASGKSYFAGSVGIGTTDPSVTLEVNPGDLFLTRTINDAYGPYIVQRKSRSAVVQSGDELGYMRFDGYDGSAYTPAANIGAVVDGTPGASDMPGALVFSTTPDGAAATSERMRISNAGNVGIGTTTMSSRLTVNGVIESVSGGIKFPDGTTQTTAATGGSLTNFIEGVNTSAPNTSVPVASLSATNAATNVDIALSPKGSGALTAQVADGTSTGGNKRGTYAVDWQNIRASAANVASGNASTIGGGTSNTASGFYTTVPGGTGNTASGDNSFATNKATTAGAYAESAFGQYNLPTGSENASSWVATDPLFVVGNGTSSAAKSNALMILKNGNVGIGTTTPGEKIEVAGNIKITGTGNGITFPDGSTQTTAPTGGSGDFMKDGSVAMTGNIQLNGHYLSGDGGNEGVFVDSSGNVGVGTSVPTAPLEVSGYAEIGGIVIGSSGVTQGAWGSDMTLQVTSAGGTSSTMTMLAANGNVGIGTTSPTATLTIKQGSANGGMIIKGTSGVNSGNADFQLISSSANGQWDIGASNSAGNFALWDMINSKGPFTIEPNASANSLYLKSGGNVGVGTSSPSTKLQVAGEISPSADNSYSLGHGALRFTAVYAVNGAIQTSDRREKTDIQPSDLGLDFIRKLQPVSYHWNNGTDNYLHYGLIAQDTEKAISETKKQAGENNLDASNVIVAHDEKTDRYGLKYTELISPLIKAFQELYDRLSGIEIHQSAQDREIASVKINDQAKDQKIQNLENENKVLKQRLDDQQKELNAIKRKLGL